MFKTKKSDLRSSLAKKTSDVRDSSAASARCHGRGRGRSAVQGRGSAKPVVETGTHISIL